MTAPAPVRLAEWPALLLCAGLATRLRPLSAVRAKAALPVAGTPLVRRLLRQLASTGVRDVVINLHHLPATVTGLVGNGHDLGLRVRYSWEDPVLGSAGGPRRALDLHEASHWLLLNGDTLAEVDLPALAADHARHGALVTLAVTEGDTSRYNSVLADAHGRVAGFLPKGHGDPPAGLHAWHFVGVQAVHRDAFSPVPHDTPWETVRQLYPALISAQPGRVRVHVTRGAFDDIGTPRDYLATVRRLAAAEGTGPDRGARVEIHPTAHVEACVIWEDVRIGVGARLRGCILTDGVQVPDGAQHEDAILIAGPDGPRVESLGVA